MAARRLVAAFLGTALFTACGLDQGGLEESPDGGGDGQPAGMGDGARGGSGGDATGGGSGSSSGGSSDASAGDGPRDSLADVFTLVDGCKPTGPENCTDGIDNDCNGLVDCQDPACTGAGYRCVLDPASAPGGWSFVAFDATTQPGCPTPLGTHAVDVNPTNLSSPASCSCVCGPGTMPSCEQGMISSTYGTGGCNNTYTMGQANNGNCNQTAVSGVEQYVQASTAPAGGSCTGTVTPTVPPTGATKGEYCDGETKFGAGCSAGSVCGLAPSGFTACLHHGGTTSCPAGYTVPSTVGTLQDTRGCGACGCGAPTATCSGHWLFFTSNNCTGSAALTLTANGTCLPTGDNGTHPYGSNSYVASPTSVQCGAPTMQPMSMGSVMLGMADTICCE